MEVKEIKEVKVEGTEGEEEMDLDHGENEPFRLLQQVYFIHNKI